MFLALFRYRRGLVLKVGMLTLLVPLLLLAFNSDPPPSRTGGFGELTCNDSGCHNSFALNPAGGSVTITGPDVYVPGQTVPITVAVQDSTNRRIWGFQLSARFRDGRQAGSLARGTNISVQISQTGIQYANHSPAVLRPGMSNTFTVMWTAPPDASGGDVIFNAAGNSGSDPLGNPAGDRIFTTQATSAAPSGATPRIFAGGIVNAASFVAAPNNAAAPGALVSIFGENLAPEPGGAVSLPLPTEIRGTRVLVNGREAPLIFVSPGQINAQIPFENISPGTPVSVAVRAGGRDSAAESLAIQNVSPGIFTINQSGTGAGAILRSDNVTLVSASAPARPGETIVIFCNALGQTQPPLTSGTAAAGQATVERPTVTIAGRNAPVAFSGASPGFAGLYQINAVVPAIEAGDHEIIIRYADGKASRGGVTVRVQP